MHLSEVELWCGERRKVGMEEGWGDVFNPSIVLLTHLPATSKLALLVEGRRLAAFECKDAVVR